MMVMVSTMVMTTVRVLLQVDDPLEVTLCDDDDDNDNLSDSDTNG